MEEGYRIQKRLYSSNIIEKGKMIDGKMKWEPYIAPLCSKKEGDFICQQLFINMSLIPFGYKQPEITK